MRTSTNTTCLRLGYVGLSALDAVLAGSPGLRAARFRRLSKPLLMPVLAAGLAQDPRAASSPLRTSTLVAQAAGWGGDVVLLRDGTRAFAAGAGCFAVGHAAYIAGWRRSGATGSVRRTRTGRLAAAVLATGGPVLTVGAYRQQKVLGPVVLGYAALLSTMLAHAGHLDLRLDPAARRLTLGGACLFVLSDSLLAMSRFVLTDPPERLETLVMATYTAGQLLISEGAAKARVGAEGIEPPTTSL